MDGMIRRSNTGTHMEILHRKSMVSISTNRLYGSIGGFESHHSHLILGSQSLGKEG
jgi:hypothetical protein